MILKECFVTVPNLGRVSGLKRTDFDTFYFGKGVVI